MTDQEQKYIKFYPIYQTLLHNIEETILMKKKMVTVSRGDTTFVDRTFGKVIFSNDVSNVAISYHLESFQYKELFIKQLKGLYSHYHGVTINEENVIVGSLNNTCDLIVRVDCFLNKKEYISLDADKKQALLQEAISNVKMGLVVFDEENMNQHQK
jgi:hypothetical protein